MAIIKSLLASKNALMPMKKTIVMVRIDNSDEVSAQVVVKNSEVRPVQTSETAGGDAPRPTKSRVFHVWVEFLKGFSPRYGDYVKHKTEWWFVESADLEMEETRWRLSCKESSDPQEC